MRLLLFGAPGRKGTQAKLLSSNEYPSHFNWWHFKRVKMKLNLELRNYSRGDLVPDDVISNNKPDYTRMIANLVLLLGFHDNKSSS
jgi:adenylate kinase family enzyme